VRQKPRFFGEVREEGRKRWNQLDGDKELGGAWWLLFKQIQNPRHVLSELLQNADDSGATEAHVAVENGCFIFRHNGHDFSEDEFRSLCRFGFSNKRRALTIGFRGIGFKSVFSLGPTAQILTPTLAFYFDRKRFTQPEWIDAAEPTRDTVLRVQIESPEKEQAIRDQIGNWISSAIPLLFFRSIRTIRLFDHEIRVEVEGAGPCARAQLVKLSGADRTVTVLRSGEEEFPPECLEEVRAERNEDIELPPCDVVVFLGAAQQQRLYCVLPTEVTVLLPFSCQAPFIQDPARTAIKDPSTSPTNAWLLKRIGILAAESLLSWLQRDDLRMADRVKAYELLPELVHLNTGLLSGTATQLIVEAFRGKIEREKLLLCADGSLDTLQSTARLPGPVIDAWGVEKSRLLFSPDKRSVLARQIGTGATTRLEAWKFLNPASVIGLFNVLADESKPAPPGPARLESLAAFWAYAKQHLPSEWAWKDWWRNAAIVPLLGRVSLGRAKDALSSRHCPAGCPAEDWQFIVDRAEILDEDWKTLVDRIRDDRTKALHEIEAVVDRRLTDRDLAGILDGYQRTRLDQSPTLDQVLGQVAGKVFVKNPLEADEAIQFLRIAARLNVSFSDSAPIRFICEDGQWRRKTEGLLLRSEIGLGHLLPAPWLQRHLITNTYESDFDATEIKTWRLWTANPQKGGLSRFPLPEREEQKRWSLNAEFFKTRGAAVPERKIKSASFQLTDRNWSAEIWSHWLQLERDEGAGIWQEITWAVVSSWSQLWDGLARYEVHQEGWGKSHRLDAKDVPATWLFELRSRKCIPDIHGELRLPSEMFRRTPDTLALLDVEPFIHDRWDQPGCERLFDELGVRTQPTDASKLLDRLRALAQVENPPIGPLRDLYRAIERVLPRLSVDRRTETLNAFELEPLVRTEAAWERSGFCFRENPSGIPGVSVVHPDVRDVIGLWDTLNIESKPSAADSLRWIASLPVESVLSAADRSAAVKVLVRYPQDVWDGHSRWLNLQARIVRAVDIRWGCLDPRAVTGLFASVRSESADFSMLDGTRWQTLITAPPRLLETALERRVVGFAAGRGDAATEEQWLHTLGEILSRLNDEEASEKDLETDRQAAQRMARTRWIPAQSVHTQPYLDGVPAGTQAESSIAWIEDSLYVQGDSMRAYKALVKEIARPFATSAALEIIRDCIGRDPGWIQAYANQHLKLVDSVPVSVPREPAVPIQAETPVAVSVFPTPRATPPEQLTDTETEEPDAHPGIDTAPPAPAPKPEPVDRAPSPKPPSKLDRLGTFLATRGFRWDEDSERFIHADGSLVQKNDGIFSWELVTPDGANPLWLASASLSDPNGIEIPAEVWLAAKRSQAVLLAPEENSFREHHFSALRSEVDDQTLELYSPVYRIRVPV
jgi:hypothetical protein